MEWRILTRNVLSLCYCVGILNTSLLRVTTLTTVKRTGKNQVVDVDVYNGRLGGWTVDSCKRIKIIFSSFLMKKNYAGLA